MDSGIKFTDVYSRISKLASTGLGRKIIGNLAQPVFVNIKDLEHKRLEEDFSDELIKDPPEFIEKITDTFKNNFAYGDLITIIGTALLTIQNRLFPTRNLKPGFIEKTFRAFALGMTFGGSLSAMLGRMFDWHKSVALGDRYAEALLKTAEKNGRQIFKVLTTEELDKLQEKAKQLNKLLVYKDSLKEMILDRYIKEDIGGLFDGPPGTGKTEGVNCILGNWSERIRSEGKEPVIAVLDLASFDEFIKEINQKKAETLEAIKASTDLNIDGEENLLGHNQGLLVLELLVKKIQSLVNKTKKHNQSSTRKQELAVFVDEFDKIFDPHTLQGCDKSRLKNLIIQFNELFVRNNILLTSNTSLEHIVTEVQKHLKNNQGSDGEEIWKPMYSRFSAKNRAIVDKPGTTEQAEILASRLLVDYKDFIDWGSFGINQSDHYENLKTGLTEKISEIISRLNLKLDGRELAYANEDIKSMLLGKARKLKKDSKVLDEDKWESLSPNQKILQSKALIDLELIEKTLSNKQSSNKIKDLEKEIQKPQKKEEPGKQLLNDLVNFVGGVLTKDRQSGLDPKKIERIGKGLHEVLSA